jgi:integrase
MKNGQTLTIALTEQEVAILERRVDKKTSGANVALIQSALNHKDLRTTLKVYAKVARRAELEAREKAHALMLSSLEVA